MEGLGEKFQKARQARNLTLEEAARMTKIRPTKLAEIEAEDFSQFPSLAYAKGFILIYGKFLSVDVSPYLEAFETSEHVTVDGYSYLQDNPVAAPRRTEIVRKAPAGNRSSLTPLLIGIIVLVAGFWFLKFMLDVRRLQPSGARDREALAQATSPSPAISGNIIAPRALPADATPAPAQTPVVLAKAAPAPPSIPERTQTIATALPPGPEGELEVRRAEPVNPQDLKAAALAQAGPSPSPVVNRFELRPLRKTYVRVTVDGGGKPVERWVTVSEPLTFRGKRIAVKVLDPRDVEIRKNGKVVGRGDSDVRME